MIFITATVCDLDGLLIAPQPRVMFMGLSNSQLHVRPLHAIAVWRNRGGQEHLECMKTNNFGVINICCLGNHHLFVQPTSGRHCLCNRLPGTSPRSSVQELPFPAAHTEHDRAVLSCAVLCCACCAGVMIVYLIIIADMLVGAAPDYAGVLPTMLGRHDNPWFLHRAFVVSSQLPGLVGIDTCADPPGTEPFPCISETHTAQPSACPGSCCCLQP